MSSFFMMDENFLLNRPRAMQLLDRMKEAGKSWALYVFSSANAIAKYSMEELVQLGSPGYGSGWSRRNRRM